MTAALDPRLHAIRADLADERLKGRVEAPRYAAGEPAQVMRPIVPMRSRPDRTAPLDNEALFGERVAVFDVAGGFAWVQLARDGYVGYVPANALSQQVSEPTHRIKAAGTFVYPAPSIKSPPLLHLSLGSPLTVTGEDPTFVQLSTGGFVFARHTTPVGRTARDFVEVAEQFISTPYLWGGRSRLGLDCSGLLQLALEAAGHACPRDSDMQQAALGTPLAEPFDLDSLERGDLVFWRGHVGVMVDAVMLLHANAHHMAVAVEPLRTAADRIARASGATGAPIAAIKRLAVPAMRPAAAGLEAQPA